MNLVNASDQFEIVYERNVNIVYKICFIYLKNRVDAEDMTQNTFIKYLRYNPTFENLKHEKNWFIKTSTNICKNHFKSWWNKNTYLTDELEFSTNIKEEDDTLAFIVDLPPKYKSIIYMHYYEGFKTKEISEILNMNESTVRTHLSKGRDMLKERMEN